MSFRRVRRLINRAIPRRRRRPRCRHQTRNKRCLSYTRSNNNKNRYKSRNRCKSTPTSRCELNNQVKSRVRGISSQLTPPSATKQTMSSELNRAKISSCRSTPKPSEVNSTAPLSSYSSYTQTSNNNRADMYSFSKTQPSSSYSSNRYSSTAHQPYMSYSVPTYFAITSSYQPVNSQKKQET